MAAQTDKLRATTTVQNSKVFRKEMTKEGNRERQTVTAQGNERQRQMEFG